MEIDMKVWQDTSDDGNPYFRVEVEGEKFLLVPNRFKTEERHPDFIGIRDTSDIDELIGKISEVWQDTKGDD